MVEDIQLLQIQILWKFELSFQVLRLPTDRRTGRQWRLTNRELLEETY